MNDQTLWEALVKAVTIPPAWLASRVQWQEDVCRVCCVYPYRVPMDAMSKALEQTGYNPSWVYMTLAEGKMIPALDTLLEDVREPW